MRLVLLAPNTESSEVLDEKIESMVCEAQCRNIPVLYSLSKRLLGKAVLVSMKQSVIGIFDPDGAYDQFKLIIRFIEQHGGGGAKA